MKTPMILAGLLLCSAALADHSSVSAQAPNPGKQANPSAQMSEDPKMRAEGARMAALMEKLQKESDAEERRKIMSEIMCPQ